MPKVKRVSVAKASVAAMLKALPPVKKENPLRGNAAKENAAEKTRVQRVSVARASAAASSVLLKSLCVWRFTPSRGVASPIYSVDWRCR